MSILNFPWWKQRDHSCQQAPEKPFTPSPSVIRSYANDIEKHGKPLDSDFSAYFRKCADYYKDCVYDD